VSRVRIRVSKDGNAVGLTSVLDFLVLIHVCVSKSTDQAAEQPDSNVSKQHLPTTATFLSTANAAVVGYLGLQLQQSLNTE